MGQSQSTSMDPASTAFDIDAIPKACHRPSKTKLQRSDSTANQTVATCSSSSTDSIPSSSHSSGRQRRKSSKKQDSSKHLKRSQNSSTHDDSVLHGSWGDLDESVTIPDRPREADPNSSWSEMDASVLRLQAPQGTSRRSLDSTSN